MYDVIIIGGGLSGLINSILLSKAGLNVVVIEKKEYPFHRVCGEYISNEVIPFLKFHDLFPEELNPTKIDMLQISSLSGRSFTQELPLGGFGISRYSYDHWLAQKAKNLGVTVIEKCSAKEVNYQENKFLVKTNPADLTSKLLIGAHSKRSSLDKQFNRSYLNRKSPFVGIKYHIETDLPSRMISLHNFRKGYCGVSKVEGKKFNLCYLTHRDNIRNYGNIAAFEQQLILKNPHLNWIYKNSKFLFEDPLVINEIQFSEKTPFENHILYSGDAAGTIAPLSGNGMANAIRSAKMLSEIILHHWSATLDIPAIGMEYQKCWKQQFSSRIHQGRQLQHLFGHPILSEVAVSMGKYIKPLSRALIKKTHGTPFK